MLGGDEQKGEHEYNALYRITVVSNNEILYVGFSWLCKNCFKISFNCQNSHDWWQLKYLLFCSKTQMPVSFFVSLFKCYDITVLFTTWETCLKRYDFLISECLKAAGPYLAVIFPSGSCRHGSVAEARLAAFFRAPAWWTQLPSNRWTPPLSLHNQSTNFHCGFQIRR